MSIGIYAVAVPKSLNSTFCGHSADSKAGLGLGSLGDADDGFGPLGAHGTPIFQHNMTPPVPSTCFPVHVLGLGLEDAYYAFLVFFTVCLGPFAYFNITKTKWLQARIASPSTPPQWGSSRFRPLTCTYDAPPCGPSVRVDELAKSRKTPTPGLFHIHFLFTFVGINFSFIIFSYCV